LFVKDIINKGARRTVVSLPPKSSFFKKASQLKCPFAPKQRKVRRPHVNISRI
jgi:hypothetical protein